MAFIDRTARAFLLWELVHGMSLTLRAMFKPKHTINYPYEKGTTVATVPWGACLAALSEWRRALHRL